MGLKMALVVLLRMYVPTNSIMKDLTVLTSVNFGFTRMERLFFAWSGQGAGWDGLAHETYS